jgi:hypothetical protein
MLPEGWFGPDALGKLVLLATLLLVGFLPTRIRGMPTVFGSTALYVGNAPPPREPGSLPDDIALVVGLIGLVVVGLAGISRSGERRMWGTSFGMVVVIAGKVGSFAYHEFGGTVPGRFDVLVDGVGATILLTTLYRFLRDQDRAAVGGEELISR